ncbi:hypothetical protein AGMMS50276_13680 [Synergistales bacterium]|nr:hypothetical protein AGMMS50276_13680 [Synergistales bacterium]
MSTHPSDVWLDEVRVKLYEETKDMTSAEQVAHINARTEPIEKKYNIKTATLPIVRRDPPQKAVSE